MHLSKQQYHELLRKVNCNMQEVLQMILNFLVGHLFKYGPNIDSWYTPVLTGNQSDIWIFSKTCLYLFFRSL